MSTCITIAADEKERYVQWLEGIQSRNFNLLLEIATSFGTTYDMLKQLETLATSGITRIKDLNKLLIIYPQENEDFIHIHCFLQEELDRLQKDSQNGSSLTRTNTNSVANSGSAIVGNGQSLSAEQRRVEYYNTPERIRELIARQLETSEELQKTRQSIRKLRRCILIQPPSQLEGTREELSSDCHLIHITNDNRQNLNNDYYFRIAESKFYQSVIARNTPIKNVAVIYNENLFKKFTEEREVVTFETGQAINTFYTFHGSGNYDAIKSICVNGFRVGGQDGVAIRNGAVHGNGVYSSYYATVAQGYAGVKCVLLCEVLDLPSIVKVGGTAPKKPPPARNGANTDFAPAASSNVAYDIIVTPKKEWIIPFMIIFY